MTQNHLCSLYENGNCTERNLEKAIYWYNKAAENDSEIAQYNLGRCYKLGIGVKKDENKAFDYCKNRPKKGIIQLKINLHHCMKMVKVQNKDGVAIV